jgi:hypothetical protein
LEGRSKELSESKAIPDFSGKIAKNPKKWLVFCEKSRVFREFSASLNSEKRAVMGSSRDGQDALRAMHALGFSQADGRAAGVN